MNCHGIFTVHCIRLHQITRRSATSVSSIVGSHILCRRSASHSTPFFRCLASTSTNSHRFNINFNILEKDWRWCHVRAHLYQQPSYEMAANSDQCDILWTRIFFFWLAVGTDWWVCRWKRRSEARLMSSSIVESAVQKEYWGVCLCEEELHVARAPARGPFCEFHCACRMRTHYRQRQSFEFVKIHIFKWRENHQSHLSIRLRMVWGKVSEHKHALIVWMKRTLSYAIR